MFTVAIDMQTHEQVCSIVDDYITFLGAPSLRAPGLALQVEVTLTQSTQLSCKISTDVHHNNKLLANINGGASIALGPTVDVAAAREDCLRALVNDQFGTKIVPMLVRAGITGPASSGAGSGAGSGSTP